MGWMTIEELLTFPSWIWMWSSQDPKRHLLPGQWSQINHISKSLCRGTALQHFSHIFTYFSCLHSLSCAPSCRHAAAGRESGDALSQLEPEQVIQPKAGSGRVSQAVGGHQETYLPSANLTHLSPPWLTCLTSLQLPQTWTWLHICI